MKRTLKSSDIVLVVSLVLLCLIGGSLVLNWQEYKSLRRGISDWNEQTLQAFAQGVEDTTLADDLLKVIDDCVEVLRQEKVHIQSFNLEGIQEEGNNTNYLRFALIRFKLRGPWEGIERGLTHLEELPDQGIDVAEAILNPDGGEILFKIYYLEPDNLSQP